MTRRSSMAAKRLRLRTERVPTIELVPALAIRQPMHALLEFDVTEPRLRMRRHRERTGEPVSLTAFLVHCIARAVDEQRGVQAFRRGRRLIVFDQVDAAILVEVQAGSAKIPVPYVVRDAAGKSVGDIQAEIRAAQRDGTLVAGLRRQMRLVLAIPRPLRWLLWRVLRRSTRLRVRFGGTVVVTSVGMFGSGRGWGFGLATYPLSVTVGGVSSQAAVREGEVCVREMLCMTVTLDHEAVDGAPAARFVARLRELVEHGDGLD